MDESFNIYEHKGKSFLMQPTEDTQCVGCYFEQMSISKCPKDSKGDIMCTPGTNNQYQNIVYVEYQKQPMDLHTEKLQAQAGQKFDSEKVDYTLIPPYALLAVAKNLTAGLKKYKERDNWKKVPDARNRYMKALYRHLEAIRRGEIYDPEALEPNTTHMSAVIANAMFLQEFVDNPELQGE